MSAKGSFCVCEAVALWKVSDMSFVLRFTGRPHTQPLVDLERRCACVRKKGVNPSVRHSQKEDKKADINRCFTLDCIFEVLYFLRSS